MRVYTKTMKLETMRDLYVVELEDLYDAENRIVKNLPKMIEAASSSELRTALTDHLEKTRGHVQRLEQIFQGMGQKAKGETCDGMKGILDEGEHMVKEDGSPNVKDAGLIAGAQRVEHYEIAAYGSVRTWAQQLGYENDANLLQQTLDEEKDADKRLTAIAESSVNPTAAPGSPGSNTMQQPRTSTAV